MNERIKRALEDFQNHWNGRASQHWSKVFTSAHAIFVAAGCEEDFCLQSASDNVVFGGSNRLIWDKRNNRFWASNSHSSETFIRAAEAAENG